SRWKVSVVVKNTTIQIQTDSGDMRAVLTGVGTVRYLRTVNVENPAIGNPARTYDVVVKVDGVRLQRSSSRVRARPDHQFRTLVAKFLPKIWPVHVEADGETNAPEIRREYLGQFAGLDRRGLVVLRIKRIY